MEKTIDLNNQKPAPNGVSHEIAELIEMLLRIATNHNETLVSDEG